jgi:hypothetical protein
MEVRRRRWELIYMLVRTCLLPAIDRKSDLYHGKVSMDQETFT